MEAPLTIDQFARATNTTVRNVRAYLERGLLPPATLVGRVGFYERSHIERMQLIQRMQSDGFSLAAIAALLEARESGTSLDGLLGISEAVSATVAPALDVSRLFPATKFRGPSVRAEHLRRARCLEREDVVDGRHVLVTAPSGAGKTIFAQQLSSIDDRPSAWLALDSGDDDEVRFWTGVLIAIRTVVPTFGHDLLAELTGGRDVSAVVVALADMLAARDTALTLVIDDLHEVRDASALQLLEWFLDHVLAEHCRLVVCSRSLPDIAVSRLVLRGKLTHLRTETLAFARDEAAEFLERLGVTATVQEIDHLVVATDGWPAGLYLVGLAMRSGSCLRRALHELRQPGRQLHEFFAREMIGVLDAQQVEFLEDIVILDRFNSELCDAVRERSDSADILARLSDNMFILPLDDSGYWWRMHQIFAAVLGARRLRAREHGTDIASSHLRAAVWHEQHDQIPEAVAHFLAAGANANAARLIGEWYTHFLNISSGGGVVDHWLSMLPPSVVAGSAQLGLAAAGVAGVRGSRDDMHRHLAAAESLTGPAGRLLPTAEFMRGCFHFGDVEDGLRWARAAYAHALPANPWFPMQGALLALLASWVDGPTTEVLEVAEAVRNSPGAAAQPIALVGASALAGYVLAARGDCGAPSVLRATAELRSYFGIDRVPQAANTWSTSARAYRLLGDLDAAVEDARAGFAIVESLEPERDSTGCVVPLLVELVHGLRLRGELDEARRYAVLARQRLAPSGAGLLPAMLADAADGL